MIRPATLDDLDALAELEKRCFDLDLLTRRSFRYMLTKAHASTLVYEHEKDLRGYALILFSRATALARLYSIAVDQSFRGHGVGRALLAASEEEAVSQGCVSLRSEVRLDNLASRSLFERSGYRRFDEVEDYYADHMGAVRYERTLVTPLRLTLARVPYYRQTLDFTCGAACLMMAMKALEPELDLSRRLELRIWREATSIFMTSGHGGASPYGLAIAASERGYSAEVVIKERGVFLVESVRNADKREVMRVVEEDFVDRAEELGIPVCFGRLDLVELRSRFDGGAIPLVLISSYRLYGERFPHWVVVTGFDERFIYVHDPYVDEKEGETIADCINMPIALGEFERMSRYGRTGQQAVVMLSKVAASP